MKVRIAGITVAALVLILVVILIGIRISTRTIPPLQVKTVDGGSFMLVEKDRSPATLVSFWASSCKVCIKEIPEFIHLYDDLRPNKLRMIGIAMHYDRPDFTLAAIKHFEIPWPVALDLDGQLAATFGDVSLTPTTFLLDHEGHVVWQRTGAVDFESLRRIIGSMLTGDV
ncbi:MAG: TlpA family protein disulfide reductase [Gammaproteobacteria bacterium]|nr:MAG: TlpA family protein disulfide reductase [Gammaproteobacteria bacterium]